MYTVKKKAKAYHGTYRTNVAGILKEHFRETRHDIWLGDGAYFFTEGISAKSPAECAKDFRVDDAKKNNLIIYDVVVLEVEIALHSDKFLDLTTNDGLILLNYYRQQITDKLASEGLRAKRMYSDAHALQLMRKNIGIEIVKGNVYIQFGQERDMGISSRMPNVTIFAVNNPQSHISKYSIKEV